MEPINNERRCFLKWGAAALTTACVFPGSLFAAILDSGLYAERKLAFQNTHTGEHLEICYCRDGKYCDAALKDINYIMRDFRTGDVRPIAPRLLDLLYVLSRKLETCSPFHIVSGYRSPRTNAMLRQRSKKVAKKSLHMQGKAVDIYLPDCRLKELRQSVADLKAGGVGFYPRSNFVHVDIGPVRYW